MMHRVMAIGRLGRDPYTTTTKSGNTFTSFTMATDGPGKTTWFKVKTWGKLAEVCGRYLRKGRLVYVDGEVDVEIWYDKEGNVYADLVLDAKTVKFLDNGHRADVDGTGEEAAGQPSESEPEPARESDAVHDEPDTAHDDFDADIDVDFDDMPF